MILLTFPLKTFYCNIVSMVLYSYLFVIYGISVFQLLSYYYDIRIIVFCDLCIA